MKKIITLVVAVCLTLVTSHVTLAYYGAAYKTNLLVTEGKKSKEVDAEISFSETAVKISSAKNAFPAKEFNYSDLTGADYSYSKKPLLSTGGAIGTALLIGVFVIPLLFMKKKQHWLTIKGKEDFAVMRLEKSNFRQIKMELEVKKVTVTTVNEDTDSDKNSKDSKQGEKEDN